MPMAASFKAATLPTFSASLTRKNRVLTIDYFHGYYETLYGVAAVLLDRPYHYDRIHIARNMIATGRSRIGAPRLRGYGFVVRRIIAIQRCFRERRRRRWALVFQQDQELGRNARRDELRNRLCVQVAKQRIGQERTFAFDVESA